MTIGEILALPALLTITEAGEALGLSRNNVYRAVATGKFPIQTVQINGRRKVPTAALMRFLGFPEPDYRATEQDQAAWPRRSQ